MGKFLDVFSNDEAKKLIASGRMAYEYKTKDHSKGPIFGPAYDDHAGRNRAVKEGRYAEDLDAAQKCAKAMDTSIEEVIFLVGK